LESIEIPGSIQELAQDWCLHSSLVCVIFESALSLRIMIDTGKVDLRQDFDVKFVECDCELSFSGYSVERVQGCDEVFRLVKICSQT
jgi:hypothetical protein